jgi:hypothetical protein
MSNLTIIPATVSTEGRTVKVLPHPMDGSPVFQITFANGWGLSILVGTMFCASGDGKKVEVALISPEGNVDYTLHDDVWTYQTPDQVMAIISQAEALPPR